MAEGRARWIPAAATVIVAATGFVGIAAAQSAAPTLVKVLIHGLPIPAALACAASWLHAARWASGRVKQGLWLVSNTVLVWASGQAIWVGDHLFRGGLGAAPLPAHVLFAGATLLVPVAALLLFGAHRVAGVRALLDAALIGASALFIAWVLVLGPLYRAQGGGIAVLACLSYPLADVAFIAIVILLVRHAAPVLRAPVGLATVGLILKCAGDFAFAYLSVEDVHRPLLFSQISWFLGFITIGFAAPRRHEIAAFTEGTDGRSGHLFVPYLPFVLSVGTAVVLFVARPEEMESFRVAVAALVALMVIRQLIALRDNQILTRRLRAAVEDLRYRAYHDPLTGLANRDKFMEAVERGLSSATGAQIAVLYIDLDGFKPINDSLGHAAGDRALTVVAERLRHAARADDLVARLGGDEFAILLPDLHHGPDAHRVAERVQTALDADLDVAGKAVRVGASIGVAYGRPGWIGLGELLRNADAAMYTAKLQGRRRTVTFDPRLLARHPLGRVS